MLKEPQLSRVARCVPLAAGLIVSIVVVLGLDNTVRHLDHTVGYQLDFGTYYAQVRRLREGNAALHDFWIYPPFAAVVLGGFAWLPEATAHAVFFVLQLAACGCLVYQCAGPLRRLSPLLRWSCAGGLVLSSAPVLHCLKWGQLSILILVLCVSALRSAASGTRAALGLSFAAAIKLYPAMYSVLLLRERGRRQCLTLLLAFSVLSILVPTYVLGADVAHAMWRRCVAAVYAFNNSPQYGSQTVQALVSASLGEPTAGGIAPEPFSFGLPPAVVASMAVVASIGIAALTLSRCRWSAKTPPSDREIALVIMSAALLSPPGWLHYLVAIPFAQAVLLAAGDARPGLRSFFVLSFALNAGAAAVMLISPPVFAELQCSRVFTLSGISVLAGLIWMPMESPNHVLMETPVTQVQQRA